MCRLVCFHIHIIAAMASTLQNLSDYNAQALPDGKNLKIGIALSEWNTEITHSLYQACLDTLLKHGVQEENIELARVPGTFELPAAARMLIKAKSPDAVICIGCVIKGETEHDVYINSAVAQGITNLTLTSGTPVIFGVLTPNTEQQAKDRAGGAHGNKGVEAAVTALRMVDLDKSLDKPKGNIGFMKR